MVATQISSLSGTPMGKSLPGQLRVHVDSPEVIPSSMEFNFSDVFGPAPVLASTEENLVNSGNSEPLFDSREVVYSDPLVVHSRLHSLVGPTNCVPKSLQFSKLTLHETEDSLELIGSIDGETLRDIDEISAVDVIETPLDDVKPQLKESQAIGLEDFEIMKVVGQGAFGRVFQVKKKSTSEIYAMKVMWKDKIMEKNHAEYMRAERDILTKIDHPFIVKLRYSFQTKYRLYLVLDFINGGHLFFQLDHHGLFREDLACIYTAEIVLAVSHLHANGIMHRDLKPENILLDADGHAMLTDFGLAKQFEENTRSNSMCGTVEYMSPEIVLGKGHDKATDWWSVGVLLFEMLTGKPPFVCGNREKIQKKIVKDKIKLPAFLSSEAHSLLKGLLQKDARKRLGSGRDGSEDIKRHKWFKSINWKKLNAREIQPSFRPNVAGKHCTANFEEHWTSMPLSDSPAASPKPGDCLFRGFTYVRPASSLQKASSFT